MRGEEEILQEKKKWRNELRTSRQKGGLTEEARETAGCGKGAWGRHWGRGTNENQA